LDRRKLPDDSSAGKIIDRSHPPSVVYQEQSVPFVGADGPKIAKLSWPVSAPSNNIDQPTICPEQKEPGRITHSQSKIG
jgi:hypothetical protein